MDIYSFGLLLGGAGLGAMAVGGLAGGIRGHAGHAHTGHAHGGHAHAGHAHAGHAHPGPAAHANAAAPSSHGQGIRDVASSAPSASRFLLSVVSPRIIFSALVGFGATGMLLRPVLGPVLGGLLLLGAAAVGGVAFERILVAPLWRFLFRFESGPAVTLESCITDEARAVTGFDAAGQGLIALELDGQVVQLLGTLTPGEQSAGLRVRAGDRVRIESVDDSRNRCTVSYLGA